MQRIGSQICQASCEQIQDHLGSVSLATDSAGAVASAQEFKPWGEVRSGSVAQTTRNYTGQQLDGTGLLYYHARYYDPVLARFISADSIVPGAAMGVGGSLGSVGQDDKVSLLALIVDFHETDFVSAINQENALILQKGFYFQLSTNDQREMKGFTGPQNPQALSRYSYVINNPLRYSDPKGHAPIPPDLGRKIVDALLQFLRNLLASGVSGATDLREGSTYNTAQKEGGFYNSAYKNFSKLSDNSLKSAYRSYLKQIEIHEQKILHPELQDLRTPWNQMTYEEQQRTLHDWLDDLVRAARHADVAKGVLAERGIEP